MPSVPLDFLGDLRRTHTCGELRASDAGKKALLMGWVHRRRDLGGVIFIHLRDRDGVTQLVFHEDAEPAVHQKAELLASEYVIAAEGTLALRTAENINPVIPTGEVELVVEKLWILNESRTPPFPMEDNVDVKEDARLKYRYIDLRRPRMQHNIILRSKIASAVRQELTDQGFLEIETPFMTRSTPEGARDYLVPARVSPGNFYALPQSPQIFKQLLMVAGFEKYFQIVRCFRDEDFRADRQAEFTQIDLEMSYPQTDTVWAVVEGFLTAAFKSAGHDIKTPFPRMSYDVAIRRYGNDKPDMRLPAMVDVREAMTAEELEDFAAKFKIRKEFPVQVIRIPKAGDISGTERRTIGTYGAYQHVQGPSFVQLMTDPKRFAKDYPWLSDKILSFAAIEPDDLWLLAGAANRPEKAVVDQSIQHFCEKCGFLRLDLAQKYAAKHKAFEKTRETEKDFRFLWVSDFPMFEWDKTEKRWNPAHHPFTSLHEEDMAKLEANIDSAHDPKSPLGEIRALAYDVVLNV